MQLHDFGRLSVDCRIDLLCALIFCLRLRHTAVADFNYRPIKDLVKDVVCREFIVKDFEKCSSNVGDYVSAERGIIPNEVAGTILSGI